MGRSKETEMDELRMMVSYSSVHGSTAEVARAISLTLRRTGIEADVLPVAEVQDVTGYDGVVLGSAVYGGKWRADALAFMDRFGRDLRERDVWLFQSGPLGHSAQAIVRALPFNVSLFAEHVGAKGYATFGGKLDGQTDDPVAKFLARAGFSGDFRDFSEIRFWAEDVARETAMHVVSARNVRAANQVARMVAWR
jgi:menaquinone-dependent protoporphyrinogen oxidase